MSKLNSLFIVPECGLASKINAGMIFGLQTP
jgi:hypothetical protein